MDGKKEKLHMFPLEHIIIIFLLIFMLILASSLLRVSSPDVREGKFLIPSSAYYNATQKPPVSPTTSR